MIPVTEYAPFYEGYINLCPEDIATTLATQLDDLLPFLETISPEKQLYAYAAGKWTLKEVLGHVIDTEKIMTYRALCIARNDQTLLPSFDENEYVKQARFNEMNWSFLLEHLEITRQASIYLYQSFNDEELKRIGMASGHTISVRALQAIIVGHLHHHINVINKLYM